MPQIPQSIEAEQGVLGSMLISPADVIPLMLETLTAFDFYGGTPREPSINGYLFSLCVEQFNAQKPVDVITLTNVLRDRGMLGKVGGHDLQGDHHPGPSYITYLFTFTPTVANARYYREIVREKSDARRIIVECEAIAEAARNGTPPDELDERIHALASERSKAKSSGSKVKTMQVLMAASVERLEARHRGEKSLKGIGTGFPMLDRKTNGWHPGQMIVIAAPEKQGKSSLARQLVEHAAVVEKVPVAVFTYEMSEDEIVDAMLLSAARLDVATINEGQTSEREFAALTWEAAKLSMAPIHIFDESHSTLSQYRANLRRAVQEFGVKMAVVDYLQLIAGDGDEKSREREVAAVSRATKQMAKELHIPILILCQLNEDGKTRESRAIQQDADKLIVISHANPKDENGGDAFLNVELSRNGAIGPVPVLWRPTFTRFDAKAFEPQRKPPVYETRPVTESDF